MTNYSDWCVYFVEKLVITDLVHISIKLFGVVLIIQQDNFSIESPQLDWDSNRSKNLNFCPYIVSMVCKLHYFF